ncbi:hypothetical protein QR680_005853 [Steinernema hermaphroditum]|uniref:Zinc finger CCCH domain-containing protein 14 n=1 Tax=Steinernema hermaphroditum TaxID=289476 RepID=A0AA39LW37_9BILA|nr:hypothetical protein QR680_005853 [Steinernema hermaphroditum]
MCLALFHIEFDFDVFENATPQRSPEMVALGKGDFATRVVPILRPAIQAKFQEMFGASLSKDLPEYVIVMLSNKKNKAYILTQFIDILGDNESQVFVDWLFKKIEEINKGANEQEAGPPEVAKPKKEEVKLAPPKSVVAVKSTAPSSSRSEQKVGSKTHEAEKKRPDDRPRERVKDQSRDRPERRDDRDRERREDRGRDRREVRDRKDSHKEHDRRARHRSRSHERRTEVDPKPRDADTPPLPKIASEVVVKRKMTSPNVAKGGSSLFLRAMNAATSKEPHTEQRKRKVDVAEVMEVEEKEDVPAKRRSVMSRISCRQVDDSDGKFTVTVGDRGNGPSVRVMKEDSEREERSGNAIRVSTKRRIAEIKHIVSGEANKNTTNKPQRQHEEGYSTIMERKPLRERLSRADGSRCFIGEKESSSESTPSTGQQWNYRIELSDNETDSEDEAMIDAAVADTPTEDKDGSPSPPSQLEDHMQPEERAFFVQTAMNKVHFNPAHPSFASKDGSGNQGAIQEAMQTVAANAAAQPGAPSSKFQTRCKFWPNCNLSDDQCPFAHPSIPCSKFPHCRFGDRCLYVHPLCRYGKLCRNSYCGYLHPTRTCNLKYVRPAADTAQSMAIS